jgi:hypothetical protein
VIYEYEYMNGTQHRMDLTSVVDAKLFFSDPDPALGLISDPDSDPDPDPACLTKVIRLYKIKL